MTTVNKIYATGETPNVGDIVRPSDYGDFTNMYHSVPNVEYVVEKIRQGEKSVLIKLRKKNGNIGPVFYSYANYLKASNFDLLSTVHKSKSNIVNYIIMKNGKYVTAATNRNDVKNIITNLLKEKPSGTFRVYKYEYSMKMPDVDPIEINEK